MICWTGAFCRVFLVDGLRCAGSTLEGRRRKELDEEKRRASARMETVREPVIDCVDPMLKHVVAREDTCREVQGICSHRDCKRSSD